MAPKNQGFRFQPGQQNLPDGFSPDAVTVRLAEPHERVRRDAAVDRHHYLGFKRFAGRGLRYIAEWRGMWIALAGWQASAFRSRHRNNWIGWPPELRFQRLHLIANNTRFLILGAKGVFPCLASFVPGAMLRRPSDDWQSRYGHPILVAETFVNPASFEGTVCRAANWRCLGKTRGFARHGGRYTDPHGEPRLLCVCPLRRDACRRLSAPGPLPAAREPRGHARRAPSELRSLCEELDGIRDFRRGQGRRHGVATAFAICILARLANRHGPVAAAEHASELSQRELKALGAWKNPKTGRHVPVSKSTLHRVITSIDPEQIEAALQRFSMPRLNLGRAIAVDGKRIRGANRNGEGHHQTATLVDHTTRAPLAALAFNEEGGEIAAVRRLLGEVPVEGRVITIDALHTTRDTATVDDDLRETTGTVTFAARNNTAQEFTIAVNDDDLDEDNETFTVTLEVDTEGNNPLPTGITIGADNSSTATITDDDEAPAVTATVGIDDESVAENVAGGTVTFTAALTAAVDSPVVLAVAVTAGTATLGVDLGTDLPTTVTIDANTTEATFTVPITDDNIVEGNETFTVTLSESDATDLPDGVTIRDGTATGTITENDAAEVTLTADTATANENGGTFSYTVSLSAAADEAVVVRWTATDGTAIVANDLQATTSTVTFAANTGTAQTFTIRPVNDDEDEDNETFTVTLEVDTEGGNPLPTGVTIGADNSSEATITDDDDAPPPENARVSIADMTAVEDAGAIGFTVSLSRAVDSGVTLAVAYTAGSADPGTDLGTPLSATVTIPEGETRVTLSAPVIDDVIAEGTETFTVTLNEDPANRLPDDVSIGDGVATGTITDNDEVAPPAPEPSVLTGPRLIGAGTALRRHAGRFDSLTGTVARNRLEARQTRRLNASKDLGSGAVAVGGSFDQGRWGAWIDGAWAGFGGNASGRQADVHGGVDYLAPGGGALIGALIGYEAADLEIGEAAYGADYTHFGVYGGARLSETLLFDGAATYGTATPDIALGGVSASCDANRITARGALTGDFGFEYGSVSVEPQLGLLYSRETLGAFTDSAGGVAGREVLQLGRFSAGPRLTWGFDGGRLTGGARMQWDFLELEDGVDGRVSGAAHIGVTLDLTPRVTLGVQGDVDGIGVSEEFGSLGGKIELGVRF